LYKKTKRQSSCRHIQACLASSNRLNQCSSTGGPELVFQIRTSFTNKHDLTILAFTILLKTAVDIIVDYNSTHTVVPTTRYTQPALPKLDKNQFIKNTRELVVMGFKFSAATSFPNQTQFLARNKDS